MTRRLLLHPAHYSTRSVHAARIVVLIFLATGCGGEQATTPPATPTPPASVVTTIVVTPATAQLTVGATTALSASVRNQRDSVLTNRVVTWASASPAVATVSTTGVVTAVAAGTARITATVDGTTGTATVTVTAAAGPPPLDFQTTVPPIDLNVVPARPTASTITLSVYSATDRDAIITLIGESRTIPARLTANGATNVELTGLAADKGYRYRIDAGSSSVNGQFRTARNAGSSFRFTMQADSHLDGNSDVRIYTNTLGNMVADSADFLVDLGDTFMSEKYADYRTAAAQYYAQRHYFGLSGVALPLYLVQGNHDGELGWTAANATWAQQQRAAYFPPVQANSFYSAGTPGSWYSWRWGDALFIVLDPFVATTTQPGRAGTAWAFTLGKAQYDWLANTLQQNTAPYTFVFLHNLVGGSGTDGRGGTEASVFYEWGGKNADGTNGFPTQRPGWLKPIHDLLVQYKASAVFHGHDHLYVKQARDGIVYQEVPQPSFARENATSSATDYGYLSGTILGSSGHLRVTVTPAKATVEYVRSRLTPGNRDVVDSYTILPSTRP